jgi:Family of unknown function (DUF5677)
VVDPPRDQPVRTEMDYLQQLLETTLAQVPQLLLEKRLAEKFKATGHKITKTTTRKAALHILSGIREPFIIDGNNDDISIQISDEDIEYVVKGTERFHREQLADVLRTAANDTAGLLYKSLSKRWPDEFKAQQEDIEQFRERLERRWGKGLAKLRMLLTIVREWAYGAYGRRRRANGGKAREYEGVMLRLHVRACQVAHEIIVLLENGLADGAMARWRTLHEIKIVAATIVRFGDEIAERYRYYQIVESFAAIKAYERDHKGLGFKAFPKRLSHKIRRDYAAAIARFGRKFGEEYGWAAHHLKIKEREHLTFARLEKEAGNAFMRSPYKMASYNVHAGPKGVYFKLGSIGGLPEYIAGASNAGLTEPAQHTAVTLFEITMLAIGESVVLDDLVAANIIARLEAEISGEFWKAEKKLRRDDKKHRATI